MEFDMNNGPEDKDKEKKSGKENHHHRHRSDRKKDKQATDKKDKKHHHHRHHHGVEKSVTPSKPTDAAPKPPLEERIVNELHADTAPTTIAQTTLKAVSAKSTPIEAPTNSAPSSPDVLKQTMTTDQGFFAKFVEWFKNKLLKPTFSRQQEIASAYSLQFLATLNAIQKQFSANDETPEKLASHKSLQFSGKTEKTTAVTAVEAAAVLDHSVNPKPTIH